MNPSSRESTRVELVPVVFASEARLDAGTGRVPSLAGECYSAPRRGRRRDTRIMMARSPVPTRASQSQMIAGPLR